MPPKTQLTAPKPGPSWPPHPPEHSGEFYRGGSQRARDGAGIGVGTVPVVAPVPALPLCAHVNLALWGEVEKPLGQESPLHGESHHQEAGGHAARPVAAEEGQQEPETEESLEVGIAETWRGEARGGIWGTGGRRGVLSVGGSGARPACSATFWGSNRFWGAGAFSLPRPCVPVPTVDVSPPSEVSGGDRGRTPVPARRAPPAVPAHPTCVSPTQTAA